MRWIVPVTDNPANGYISCQHFHGSYLRLGNFSDLYLNQIVLVAKLAKKNGLQKMWHNLHVAKKLMSKEKWIIPLKG